jgi:hypothetical protein
VVKIQRAIRKGNTQTGSSRRRSIGEIGRDLFARESQAEFAMEALLFGVLVAVSAWPIAAAAGAINQLM